MTTTINALTSEASVTQDDDYLEIEQKVLGVYATKKIKPSVLNAKIRAGLRFLSGAVTTFNSNGSITTVYDSGQTKTDTFNSNGTITTVYGSPISKTVTTTISGNTITETI